jgi:hypothetical protein
MSVAHCGEAYPRAPWTVRWFAVLARDGTSASSNRRGKETANWQRGHVLMWPSPRSQPACSPTVTPIERPLDDRGRGRKRRHAGAARRPKGPEQGPREPDGVPREAQPKPPGPGGTGPRVADEAPAYPSHPGPLPGTDGAWPRRLRVTSTAPAKQTPCTRTDHSLRCARSFSQYCIRFFSSASKPRPSGS